MGDANIGALTFAEQSVKRQLDSPGMRLRGVKRLHCADGMRLQPSQPDTRARAPPAPKDVHIDDGLCSLLGIEPVTVREH